MTDPREMRKGAGCFALFSLAFVGAGVLIILQAYDIVPHGRMNVPRWVAAAAGAAFLAPGLCMLAMAVKGLIAPASMEGPQPGFAATIVATMLTGMALVFGGAALVGDARGFYGGLTGSVIEGRIVFGFAALVLAAIAGVFWLLLIARALSGRGKTGA